MSRVDCSFKAECQARPWGFHSSVFEIRIIFVVVGVLADCVVMLSKKLKPGFGVPRTVYGVAKNPVFDEHMYDGQKSRQAGKLSRICIGVGASLMLVGA